ncbi:MAG: hypothetical protein FWC03_07835 [Treponema sp.]|nr:hypothetical protein [Treponema sp.]
MKKTTCIIAIIAMVAALFASCATGGGGGGGSGSVSSSGAAASSTSVRKSASRVPEGIMNALINAPEDALVGIGSAKMGTESMSRTTATLRARAEISRQMSTMIQDMIRDYTASSEVDPSATLSFTENITVALSKAELTGSRVTFFEYTDDGTCYVVVTLGQSNAAEIINQQQAAAKLAVPAMASFNAEDRMKEAFASNYNKEVQVNTTAGN